VSGNRLLIIEDDPPILRLVEAHATRLGFDVTGLDDPSEFRNALRTCNPTAIILDLSLPTVDGIEIVRYLGRQRSQARVALMSGHGARILETARRAALAEGLRVLGTIEKPFREGHLEQALVSLRQDEEALGLSDLQEAIDKKQFVMRYQPKARCCKEGALTVQSVEALIRWEHPRLGLLSPDRFLSLAEGSELIFPLSTIALETSLRDRQTWAAEGLDLGVAVNFSPRLLSDWDLPDQIRKVLERTGVDASHVTLEITERGITEDPVQAMEVLTRLRLRGVGLSLDDFGTGNATLSQLLRMPFSEVKLDRTLFENVEQNPQERAVVSSLVKMFHYLQLEVCAEGLETQGVLDLAADFGCDLFQGYFIGRPMTPEMVPTAIAAGFPSPATAKSS
jgi:EAL domain-containing protein (putative c-di-GMP-specific phosphodiesterase class I)/ActR/RegA family two-component response regulator